MIEKRYIFAMPNKKVVAYYMTIFAVVLLFTTVLSAALWDVMFIPLILVLLGTVGVFIVAKKYTIRETVTLDKAGIASNIYGRINFADIKSVRSFSVHRGSTIEVILKSGKKYRWVKSLFVSVEANRHYYNLFHQLPESFDAYRKREKRSVH